MEHYRIGAVTTVLAVLMVFILGLPCAVAVELLVSSSGSDRIIRYDGITGAVIDTFVPPNSGGLANPQGLVFGPDGNLYVASSYFSASSGDRILRYDGATGDFIDTFVPPNSGGLFNPQGLVFGPDGNLYVSSSGGDRILRYDGTTGDFIDAFVPPGSSNGGLFNPTGLGFGPDGHLYVSSSANNRILRYNGTTGGFIDTFVPPMSGGLGNPQGLVFGTDGNLYVASSYFSASSGDRILRYEGTTGDFIDTFVSPNSGGLFNPTGLVFGPDGHLYVSSSDGNQIIRYDGATGAFIDTFVSSGSGGLDTPSFLTFSPTFATPIPEPSTILLFGVAMLGIVGCTWQHRKRAA